MTNTQNQNNKYDLEERTAKFAEVIIDLRKEIKITPLNSRIIPQLIGCSGSIGANYCEADDSESKADFRHKIGICEKESREAKHFLRMTAIAVPEKKDQARILWLEAKELNLIFNSIYKKVK